MINKMNGNSYSDWGMPALPGFSATTQAMRALTANSNALYGGGDFNPILDVVSLGNPYGSGYDDVGAMKNLSRRMAAQRQLGAEAPSDLLTMPADQFLNYMAGQLSALRAAQGPKANQGGGKAKENSTSTGAPLQVHAHERYDSEGKAVPVTSTVISEAGMGKWGTREYNYNPSGLNQADSTYGRAQLGKFYNVTVTWANGESQTTQVKDKGWALELY